MILGFLRNSRERREAEIQACLESVREQARFSAAFTASRLFASHHRAQMSGDRYHLFECDCLKTCIAIRKDQEVKRGQTSTR